MSVPLPDPAAIADAGGPHADQAWRALHGMGEIQFAPVTPPPPDPPYVPPDWLRAVMQALARGLEWLGEHVFVPLGLHLSHGWRWVVLVLGLAGIVALVWLAWVLLAAMVRKWRARAPEEAVLAGPSPEALALLEEADRLAAQGDYGAAVHLLLRRSVGLLAAARPDLLHPSNTAREIAGMPALPGAARLAFATMAGEVERARYALRAPGPQEWARARGAYAAFAAQPLGAGA